MAGHPEDTKTWIEWIENGGVYDQTGETDVIVPMNSFWKKAPVGGELNSSISMRRMLVKKPEWDGRADPLISYHISGSEDRW